MEVPPPLCYAWGMTVHTSASSSVGRMLREWRQRRRMSQLDLSCEAAISTRHLSFLETGRAAPSRDMLLHLAERLDVPLRDRNLLLTAAGYAPAFPERSLDDPAMAVARQAMLQVLRGHEPYPALAIDRHWNMVAANRMIAPLLQGLDAALLTPPVNVMRLSLHPEGLAPRIVDLPHWRAHLLARLRRQIDLSADPVLIALLGELEAYPVPAAPRRPPAPTEPLALAFQVRVGEQVLSFFSTTMLFGTPIDVTVAELAIESFFPTDAATTALMHEFARTFANE